MGFKAKRTSLIVLIVLLVVSLFGAVCFGLTGKTNDAKAYVNTIRYGSNGVYDYNINHWKNGQGQRVSGQPSNGGTWWFGYGDISTTTSTWTQTATFNSANIGFYDAATDGSGSAQHSHNYFWGFNASTRDYSKSSTQTMFKYLAEADGFVKLSGIISKHVYGGSAQFGIGNDPHLNFNWGAQASTWTWNDGASFTIGIWRVTSAGKIACVDEQTFTSAFRYDVNPNKETIAVESGDILYVTIKCNNPGTNKGDWDNTCLTLLSSEFTAYTAPSETYADTAVASTSYVNHMTAQNVRSTGETSGYWRYGYGDAKTGGSYSFTAMTYGVSGSDTYRYTSSAGHNIFWGSEVTTSLYTTSSTQTFFEWNAEANCTVSFTGLVKKADSNTRVLISKQNNVAKVNTSNNFDQNQFGWTNGDSYTLTVYKVTKSGTVSVVLEKTFTSEFALLIPSDAMAVEQGDRIVFGYKCNALAGSSTNAVIAIKAKVGDVAPTLGLSYLDRMVLQANANTKINGFGIAGKTVEVTIKDSSSNTIQTKTGTVASNGAWTVTLDPMVASFDYKKVDVKYAGSSVVKTISNVQTGEVWLCSGQSNMQYTLASLITDRFGSTYSPWSMTDEQIRTVGLGDYLDYGTDVFSKVRLFQVNYNSQATPDEKGVAYQYTSTAWAWSGTLQQWMGYSAYALGFAFRMQQALNCPVGIIVSAVGGSSIEEWLSEETVTVTNTNIVLKYDPTAKAPYKLYNGMLHPIRNVTVKGFMWYQGCADSGTAYNGVHDEYEWVSAWKTKMVGFAAQLRRTHGQIPIICQQIVQDNSWIDKSFMYNAPREISRYIKDFYVVNGMGAGEPYSYALAGNIDPTDISNTIHPIDKYGISRDAGNIAANYVYGYKNLPGMAAYPQEAYLVGTTLVVDYGAGEAGYKLKLTSGTTVNNLQGYNGSSWVTITNATVEGTKIIIPNGSAYTKLQYARYNIMGEGYSTTTKWATTYSQYISDKPVNLYTENGLAVSQFVEFPVTSKSTGVNMTLGEDLSLNYTFMLKDPYLAKYSGSTLVEKNYTNPVVHFSYNGRNVEVPATDNGNGTYTAKFVGINPQDLNNGVTVSKIVALDPMTNEPIDLYLGWSKATNYSALNYLTDLKATDTSAKTQKIIVNLLNYGAAAQTYLGHDTSNLVNAGLSSADQTNYAIAYDANAVSASAVRSLTGTAVNSVKFDSAKVYYSNKLGFGIIFKVANSTSGTVALNVSSSNVNVDITDFAKTWDDGAYTYYVAIYEGIHPSALATEFNFTVKINGAAVGQVLNYNIYANMAMLANAGDNNAKLLKALYAYSEAVKAYNA